MTESVSSENNRHQYTIDAFFSGVGGIELGFEQTGKFRTVYANEFDKNAQITYRANHPDTQLDGRDIHEVTKDVSVVPDADIIVGGFPCQAFSIAGYRKGFEDERGDLFFELLKIIKKRRPKAIFIENVKNLVTHDHGKTFKIIREALTLNGYYVKWKVLNGKDYGNVPQNRERIYIVGFSSLDAYKAFQFPAPIDLTKTLDSVIDFRSNNIDSKYYYEDGKQPFYDKLKAEVTSQKTIYQWRRQYVRENKSGVIPTLTANMGTGGHNVPLILADNGIRKLTPRETFNAQGYPGKFILPDISNGQLYKQAGNSVVVPVIRRIADNIGNALNANTVDLFHDNVSAKYEIMHTKMDGRFEGESEFIVGLNSTFELREFSSKYGVEFMHSENYQKSVSKNVKLDFYNYE